MSARILLDMHTSLGAVTGSKRLSRRSQQFTHIHNDPFDRLLLAQAQFEPMTLLAGDRVVGQYGTGIVQA